MTRTLTSGTDPDPQIALEKPKPVVLAQQSGRAAGPWPGMGFVFVDALPAHRQRGSLPVGFIGLLWLTEAVHLTVTALLVPLGALLLGFPGLTTSSALAPFADPIVFLFLGGFALATALRAAARPQDGRCPAGAVRWTFWPLGVPAVRCHGSVLSMGISNTATAAMMLPLTVGILSPLDADKDRRTFSFVLLGVAYAASIGGIGTLVGSPPNAIAARAADIDFAQWLWIGIPLVLVLMPVMVLTLWLVLRPKLNRQIGFVMADVPWTCAPVDPWRVRLDRVGLDAGRGALESDGHPKP